MYTPILSRCTITCTQTGKIPVLELTSTEHHQVKWVILERKKNKSNTSIGCVNISQRVVFFWLLLFCFSGVFDPGEGRGGAGLFGVEPLTEGFLVN